MRRLNKLIIERFKTQYRQIKTCFLYKILESAEDKFRPGKSTNIETVELATSIFLLMKALRTDFSCLRIKK